MANSKSVAGNSSNSSKKLTASQRFWQELRGYAEALVIAFIVVTFVFNTVGVVGSSMRPNLNGGVGSSNVLQSLLTGDRVFIPKYDTWLRRAGVLGHYNRGDIVVVREPENAPSAQERGRRPFFIKRVMGVPGDHVRIEDGQVIINDFAVDQSFITASGEITPDPNNFPQVIVEDGQVSSMIMGFLRSRNGTPFPRLPDDGYMPEPVSVDDTWVQLYYGNALADITDIPDDVTEGEPVVLDIVLKENEYFVMGDNRDSSKGGSEDSRYFGPVKSITIAGKATAVIWPPRRDGAWNWRRLTPPETFSDVPAAP